MQTKEYNGWTNYETWVVKLWIDNEQSSHEFWRDEARELYESSEATKVFTKDEQAEYDLAEKLKDYHDTRAQDMLKAAESECTFLADLLGAALSEVNWQEIAHSLIESAKESIES